MKEEKFDLVLSFTVGDRVSVNTTTRQNGEQIDITRLLDSSEKTDIVLDGLKYGLSIFSKLMLSQMLAEGKINKKEYNALASNIDEISSPSGS